MKRVPHRLLLACVLAWPALALAGAEGLSDWDAKFQSTYVWQAKPAFRAAYTGPRSLEPSREKGYTFSASGYLGWRLAPSTEFYLDPEVIQGVPLSHLQGLAGVSNGEATKSAGANPVVYRARAFVRQTWGLGGERIDLGADKNQLAGSVDADRVVLTAGNFSVTDVFDRSDSSGDPRTQFLNASFVTHGAFDYPADARGYTWGVALEWFRAGWQLRAGHFLLPSVPNGPSLDWKGFRHYGEAIEAVHAHRIGNRDGSLRWLAFRDHTVLARFDDALALSGRAGGVPSLDAVRTGERSKRGFGVALDQAITPDIGVFARAARSDGATEEYAFLEIDQSLAAGALVHGAAWGRAGDSFGAALARNGLSAAHRGYLAAGGLGSFVGDGRLTYRPEKIAEVFYSAALGKHFWLSGDLQHIRHPAYNADRGPVRVASVRLHTEW